MGFFGDIKFKNNDPLKSDSATLRAIGEVNRGFNESDASGVIGGLAALPLGGVRDIANNLEQFPAAASNMIEDVSASGVGDAFRRSLGITSQSPSAPIQSGGNLATQAAKPAAIGSLPQPSAQASPAPSATIPQPHPKGVGLNGQPLQGAAAATFKGYQPNGVPIFQAANPEGLDQAGRIANEAKLGLPTPASGHFNQAASDKHAAEIAALSAQGEYFRQSRLQSDLATSSNPAVLQAAAGMSNSVASALGNYQRLQNQALGGGVAPTLTPEMKQQLAFEQAKIGLLANTPRGQAEARHERNQASIDELTKSLASEKDPVKRETIRNQLSGLGVKMERPQPRVLGQFTRPDGTPDTLIQMPDGRIVMASDLAAGIGGPKNPFDGVLGLPPSK